MSLYGSSLTSICPNCCKSGYWKKAGESYQNSGYSFSKGLVGTALFGTVGAVAGINGKKNKIVQYMCSNCNYIYTHTYKPGEY